MKNELQGEKDAHAYSIRCMEERWGHCLKKKNDVQKRTKMLGEKAIEGKHGKQKPTYIIRNHDKEKQNNGKNLIFKLECEETCQEQEET